MISITTHKLLLLLRCVLLQLLLVHIRCCEGRAVYGDPFAGRSYYRYSNDFGWLGHHESRNLVMASTSTVSSPSKRQRQNNRLGSSRNRKYRIADSQSENSNRVSNGNGQVTDTNPGDMSLEELRASLPVWAKLIANTIEVGFVTATSYLSGGFLGYGIGGVMSSPLFFKTPQIPGQPLRGLRAVNAKAVASGKSWGELNAAFSGFNALIRVSRNGKEDRFNSIFSSFCTGAYLNRQQGTQAMIRNAATFASFTYLVETFFGFGSSIPESGEHMDDEFGFREVDVE